MNDAKSLPELNLFSFTNKRCITAPITPHEGRQITKRKTKSCISRHSKGSRYVHGTSSTSARSSRLSSSPALQTQILSRTPGYTLARTSSSVEVKINVDKFFQKKTTSKTNGNVLRSDTGRNNDTVSAEVVEHLTQEMLQREETLQREIVELAIKLDSIKKVHEEDIKKKDDENEKTKKRLQKAFETERQLQQHAHDEQLKQVYNRHQDDLQSQKSHLMAEKAQLEEEIELHKKLMEDTKRELRQEAEERLRALETAMRLSHEEEMNYTVNSLEVQRESAVMQLRDELTSHYETKIADIQQEHEEIVNEMKNKNLTVTELQELLDEAQKNIEEMELEKTSYWNSLKSERKEKLKIETQLYNTKSQLDELQQCLQEKVRSFEDRYLKKLDNLKLENSKLRSRLMEQVDKISEHRADISRFNTKSKSDNRSKIKSVMQARTLAHLSLVAEPSMQSTRSTMMSSDSTERPGSAPSTSSETQKVFVMALTQEQRELSKIPSQGGQRSRPYTCR